MATAITGFTPTTPTPTTDSSGDALSKVSAGDFIKVMLAQLQQQDPLNPSDSNQLLTQMSQISQLQSSTNLNTTLQGLTLQQSLSAGAGMMGKTVTGLDVNGNQINGQVTSVQVQNQNVILGLADGTTLPLTNVTQIVNTPLTTVAPITTTPPTPITPAPPVPVPG